MSWNRVRQLLRPVLGLALFLLFWQLATLGNKATDVPPPYAMVPVNGGAMVVRGVSW